VIERHYDYDPSGQLKRIIDKSRGLTQYGYDPLGRITHSQIGLGSQPSPLNETFHWDAASNPAENSTRYGEARPGPQGNRLTVWQDQRFDYDVHGNLVHRLQGKRGSAAQTETRLSWDAAHQLVQAQVTRGVDGDSSLDETQTQTRATTQTYHYGYDALGRRVFKADAFGTTVFAWDGDQQVLELRGASQTHTIYQPNSFVPLAQVHNGHLHHLHTDHLGTPLEASNDAGELTWRVTYRTWGNVVREEWEEGIASGLGSEADADPSQRRITQNLRFQGQYFDAETGLHYNRFRYYDPTVGRFVSQDPIGLKGGFNTFQYATNPVGWIDPMGLAGNPATATHITYQGMKDGKPYVGYASMQGCQDPRDVLKYRYSGDFSGFEGGEPRILYSGYGQGGKDTARGLEQSTFEKLGGLGKTSNKQNPVGQGNGRKNIYKAAAAKHCPCGKPQKPDCN
jgi:RHS repeat-associated protein